MEVTIIVSLLVSDFSLWQEGFFSGAAMRDEAGIQVLGVYRDLENGNSVTVVTEAPSAEVAEAFIFSPELRMIWEKIGVIGEPKISVLRRVF